MDEQQLQQQIVQLVQAAMQGDQQAIQQIQQIMQAAQQGDQQAAQLAQMIQAVAQQMQQQQVQAAKFGAKLNYIRQLRGVCPEGQELEYYRDGGRLCKKCVQKHKMQDGGEVPSNPVDAFKCGRKMKRKENGGNIKMDKCGSKVEMDKVVKKMKKKACGGPVKKAEKGTDLPTAPSAKVRYSGGAQGRVENSNPYLNNSFGYLGYPRLTDYDVVQGNDGNFLYNPSVIGKGYDYQRGDSVAIEIPRHIPQIVLNTAEPVYQSQNPSEFNRLSRRVDEARSVSKKK